jgi:hypothetical protein
LKPLVVSRFTEQGVSTPCPQMGVFAKVLRIKIIGFIIVDFAKGENVKE